MSKIHHFKGFSVVDGDMKIKLNMDRFSRQYQEAQYLLDGMVMDSMVPFMPMEKGTFVNVTRLTAPQCKAPEKFMRLTVRRGGFCMRAKEWSMKRPEAHMQEKEPRKSL